MNNPRKARDFSGLWLLLAVLVLASVAASPAYALTGAIWTTNSTGEQVNQNIYDSKEDVYLNGGPAPSGAQLPEGDYFFQVTDPSGSTLLSSDDITDRQFRVNAAGVIDSAVNHPTSPKINEPAGSNAVVVQLVPYLDTTNDGGEYKVWVTRQQDYDPTRGSFGFVPSECKTDNFKIRVPVMPQYLKIEKFKDSNANGLWDPEEEEIEGWQVDVRQPDGPVSRYYTPIEIVVSQGCWEITEVISARWMQTGLLLDGVPQSPVGPRISLCFVGDPGETHEVAYGNIPLGSISGAKFKDCDADGVWDDGELGIGGWRVYLAGTDVRGNPVSAGMLTGADGRFKFVGFLPGVYTVSEEIREAWQPTTDPFFVENLEVGEDFVGPAFGNIPLSTIAACKFYDADLDSTKDEGEALVNGIRFVLTGTDVTGAAVTMTGFTADGRVAFTGLLPGTYALAEELPPNWVATTPAAIENIGIGCNGPSAQTFEFGDVRWGCPRGGHTLGYWSNKNGQATMTNVIGMDAALAALRALNLVNANGTDFDPTEYRQFRTWLLSANATYMGYMLSAQLAAMKLNVMAGAPAGFVNGNAFVYAPGVPGANDFGFIKIKDLMAAANALLPGTAGDRDLQEIIKNALDSANNNKNFLCLGPGQVAYP